MEETINIREIFKLLKKRLIMICAITLAFTTVSAIYTYLFITPEYEATTQMLVNQASNDQSQYNLNQIETNVQYINTYSVIIKSPIILDDVINELNLDMTVNNLKSILNVSSKENSQVFTVTVQDVDSKEAVSIANTVASVFKEKIPTIMNVDNVSILSKAQLSNNAEPVSPNLKLNMIIAFVFGLIISIGLVFLLEYLNNTIRTVEDIEDFLELPLLGVVSETNFQDVKLLSAARSRREVRGDSA